jgi:hypothetical protein
MFTKKIVYLEPTDSLLEHAKTRHFSLIAIALGLHAPSEAETADLVSRWALATV